MVASLIHAEVVQCSTSGFHLFLFSFFLCGNECLVCHNQFFFFNKYIQIVKVQVICETSGLVC